MAREVLIYCELEQLQFDDVEVAAFFTALDELYAGPQGLLSVAFLRDDTLREIHAEFLRDKESTDVITFPGDIVENFAGEICVSVDYAATYAEIHGKNFAEELTLYLVHGWLHLCGLDDIEFEDITRMRLAEERSITFLKSHCLMPNFVIGEKSTS
jgi:probable rRNA maturation factor